MRSKGIDFKDVKTIEVTITSPVEVVEIKDGVEEIVLKDYIRKENRLVASNVDAADDILNWVALKDVPNGFNYRITDASNIPTDRTFRDAWTDANPTETVDVDMEKARDIHMNNIRLLRDKKFKELDVETMKGNNVQAQKQVLRDIPQTFDLSNANTPEELKILIPTELT